VGPSWPVRVVRHRAKRGRSSCRGARDRHQICSACRGVACIFDQTDLSVFDKHDMDYYQGNGAPARGVIFRWIKAFSDGASQQFMCNVFLYFLSLVCALFFIGIIWNWFCSCHSKCVCDPEGGSLKAAADAYEAQDSPLGDRRMVIRNARELVMCGHQNLGKPKSNFFSERGDRRVPTLVSLHSCSRARGRGHEISSEDATRGISERNQREGAGA